MRANRLPEDASAHHGGERIVIRPPSYMSWRCCQCGVNHRDAAASLAAIRLGCACAFDENNLRCGERGSHGIARLHRGGTGHLYANVLASTYQSTKIKSGDIDGAAIEVRFAA